MTAMVQRVPAERMALLREQAREPVQVGGLLANVVAAVLIGLGRLVARLVTAGRWVWLAYRTGYRDVRPRPEPEPDDAAVAARRGAQR